MPSPGCDPTRATPADRAVRNGIDPSSCAEATPVDIDGVIEKIFHAIDLHYVVSLSFRLLTVIPHVFLRSRDPFLPNATWPPGPSWPPPCLPCKCRASSRGRSPSFARAQSWIPSGDSKPDPSMPWPEWNLQVRECSCQPALSRRESLQIDRDQPEGFITIYLQSRALRTSRRSACEVRLEN